MKLNLHRCTLVLVSMFSGCSVASDGLLDAYGRNIDGSIEAGGSLDTGASPEVEELDGGMIGRLDDTLDAEIAFDLGIDVSKLEIFETVDANPTIEDAFLSSDGSFEDGRFWDGGIPSSTQSMLYMANLNGLSEIPSVNSNATGTATFELSSDKKRLWYRVTHNVSGANAAHIHLGAAGSNGPALYALMPLDSDMGGTISITTEDLHYLQMGMLYINIHSYKNSNGEIRGQIIVPGDSIWVAHLTGVQQTPPTQTLNEGDAAFVLDQTGTRLRYSVVTTGFTSTNAYIRKAIAGMSGEIVFPLLPVGEKMQGIIHLSAMDARNLQDGLWYISLQSESNPNGHLRGQIIKPGELLFAATLSGSMEVPAVSTDASGAAQLILDPEGISLRYEMVLKNAAVTSVNIHRGPLGSNGAVLYSLLLAPGGAKGNLSITKNDLENFKQSNLYINVNTIANPKGEIRGQIKRY